ncbi:MAG: cupredoxin domain-containing protein, partial [Chloroflexota bacterium]|nr:cupredoxin domain-containing protein [Chloroflexota bacterium]
MNTRKQIDIMVALLFLTVLAFGIYFAWDPVRASDAEERQLEEAAERGAKLFAQNCRACHGKEGRGPLEDPSFPGFALNLEANRPTDPSELAALQAKFRDTIRCGRVGRVMPAWSVDQGGSLNDEQIRQLMVLITTNAGDAWAKEIEESKHLDEQFELPPPPAVDDPAFLNKGACGQVFRGGPAATATPAAPATPPAGPEVTYDVEMGDNFFRPNQLAARPGQKVIINLVNKGVAVHNMRQAGLDNQFQSGDDVASDPNVVNPGQKASLEFTIDQAGTYKFRCDFHPVDMTG